MSVRANRFSMLEATPQPRETRTKAAPVKPAAKPVAKPAASTPAPAPEQGFKTSGGRGRGRGGPNHRDGASSGGHGRGAPRENRENDGKRPPRRQFDRHSAQGKNNPNRGGADWGSDQQEIVDFQKNQETVVVEPVESPAPPTEEEIAAKKALDLEILGPENKSLAEELAERKLIGQTAEVRASRNADFAGRKTTKTIAPTDAETKAAAAQAKRKPQAKVVLSIDAFVPEEKQTTERPPRTENRGRGGDKRGGRGSRGGGRRGGKPLDLNNEESFPKMG